MKHKIAGMLKALPSALKQMFPRLWRGISFNLVWKLMSLLFALFLWSYVITTSPNITREKMISGVDIVVTGQSALGNRLAVLTDTGQLEDVLVRVRVAQSSFSQVTSDNVRVELDLSTIRTVGKHSVRLRGTSTYGTITQIWPQYIELEVENRDERIVPVRVMLSGEKDPDYWYWAHTPNPERITVTGPASLVQMVSSASAELDVTNLKEPYNGIARVNLLNAQREPITAQMGQSSSSVALSVDVYPQRTVDIVSQVSDLCVGQVPRGYEIAMVDVEPKALTVAADQQLLDSLGAITIEPVDVTGRVRTFTGIAKINAIEGMRNLSSKEVTVKVTIQEQSITRDMEVPLQLVNMPGDKLVSCSVDRVDVRITGPYSVTQALSERNVLATVNLAGLTSGEYELPVEVTVVDQADVMAVSQTADVRVTVRDGME